MNERIIGVMSGTSLDGIDTVLLEFPEGLDRPQMPILVERDFMDYSQELKDQLIHPERLTLSDVTTLHRSLSEKYAAAITKMPSYKTAQCIGLHGQTVWHQPNHNFPSTLQLGNGSTVALRTGIDVVSDFRSADMAVGGQGAPLVPFAHWFMLQASHPNALVVNLGGICNLTKLHPSMEQVIGFDVGPGMMLLDGYVRMKTKKLGLEERYYDKDGLWSTQGSCISGLLQAILEHSFCLKDPPKSTGREEFGEEYLRKILGEHASDNQISYDVAHTLAIAPMHILRATIERLQNTLGHIDSLWLVGGGAYHPTLRTTAEKLFPKLTLHIKDEGPMAPNNVEAVAMAILAGRTYHNLPSNIPNVTGATQSVVLGQTYRLTRAHSSSPTQPENNNKV